MLTLLGFLKAPRLVAFLLFVIVAVGGYTLYFYERARVAELEGKLKDCAGLVESYKIKIESAVSACTQEKQILKQEFERRLKVCQERLSRCGRLRDILNEIEELE